MNTRWGEKTRTDSEGKVAKAWDHDPPAKEKLVPFGSVKDKFPNVRRLTIYLDNGPKNSGMRTQFLKRMIEFADWSGLEIHLVYYPPYHSKYNRIERCWSSLQQKWNGVLLTCWEIVKACAERMTWKGQHPTVMQLDGDYPIGVIVPKKEMKELNKRLERAENLAKYDIRIRPLLPRGR